MLAFVCFGKISIIIFFTFRWKVHFRNMDHRQTNHFHLATSINASLIRHQRKFAMELWLMCHRVVSSPRSRSRCTFTQLFPSEKKRQTLWTKLKKNWMFEVAGGSDFHLRPGRCQATQKTLLLIHSICLALNAELTVDRKFPTDFFWCQQNCPGNLHIATTNGTLIRWLCRTTQCIDTSAIMKIVTTSHTRPTSWTILSWLADDIELYSHFPAI